MDIFNMIVDAIFGVVFLPFDHMAPIWGMMVVSAITGVVMLVIFKATSDQAGIKQAKNFVKGHFLAIRLYKDDVGLMMDTMKNILASNLLYMKQSLRPMLFLLLPVAVILIQLGVRYEFRPLQVGESTVVTLRVADESVRLSDIKLALPPGLSLDMPPVRIEQLREVSWRVKAVAPGDYQLLFRHGEQAVAKNLRVDEALVPVTPQIARDDLVVAVMNPTEASLPESAFASLVSVDYPQRSLDFLGMEVHWLVAFFVISLVAAFGLKGVMGVEV